MYSRSHNWWSQNKKKDHSTSQSVLFFPLPHGYTMPCRKKKNKTLYATSLRVFFSFTVARTQSTGQCGKHALCGGKPTFGIGDKEGMGA